MNLNLIPLLRVQRDLYDIPIGWERFKAYLTTMTGGGDDIVLPLVGMNPMGKEHVAAMLDDLIAFDAEAVAASAIAEAGRRLIFVAGRLDVGLVSIDDARGGWTNRYCTEMQLRFDCQPLQDRAWAVVPIWTGEVWSPPRVREEVLATIYRLAYMLRHGHPKTLRQMMRQEGAVGLFAGAQGPMLDPDDLEYTGEVLAPYRDSADYPTVFACLNGDLAARSVGYPGLGLSPRAGYALALAEARQAAFDPVALLQERSSVRA